MNGISPDAKQVTEVFIRQVSLKSVQVADKKKCDQPKRCCQSPCPDIVFSAVMPSLERVQPSKCNS